GEENGARFDVIDIPAEQADEAQAAREQMIERLGEVDDEVMALYLEGKPPSEEQIRAALRRATIAMKAIPVTMGAAFKNKGVQPLLDAVVDFLPSPGDIPPVKGTHPDDGREITRKADDKEPFAGLAFKIMNDPFVGQLTFFRVYSG